ncbi:transglutaminase family protein [Sphingomonas montana]|uniref:transglutaminase family protein n=1 Tax=Sphingomonas montana TaxID=1843236 RepID=UPI00096DF2EA|nr:transglutaminase family protein [Sphingomonas montana]
MRLNILHRTSYAYSQPQARLMQLLRMTPSSHIGQHVVDWRIDIDRDARLRYRRDGFGNETAMLYVEGPVDRITLTVAGEVLTEDTAGIVQAANEPLPPLVYLRATPLTEHDDAIATFARDVAGSGADGGSPLDRAHALNRAIGQQMRFDTGTMNVERSAAAAFGAGHGVCQDMAHVFIAGARVLGLPARYVSGHLFRRDGASDQPAAHAWAEAHVDGIGWIGFDPANAICPDDAYVRVAVGLDYREAAPVSGARTGGGVETLDVGVRVGLSQSQSQG